MPRGSAATGEGGGLSRKDNERLYPIALAGLVSLSVFIVYLATLRNGFVNWDDDVYIVKNIHLSSLNAAFFRWAFFDFNAANWHPLTWVSHALDRAVWGLHPAGHHLTNNILHAANTFLSVLLVHGLLAAWRERPEAGGASFLDGRGALIAAGTTGLLFGLHPMHVESVAWVAERKDILCAFFYLLSVLAYLRSAGSAEKGFEKTGWMRQYLRRWYLASFFLFALALMSKPMAVSLPLALLILDWYPLRSARSLTTLRRAIIEKLPFFLLSVGSSVLTLLAQKEGETIIPLAVAPLLTRVFVGLRSLVVYLWKIAVPLDLLPLYAYPKTVSFLSPGYLVPVVLVVVMLYGCIRTARKYPVWTAAGGYYLVTLLPVIGIIQVGNQAMADRYAYLPCLGPFLLLGLAASRIWSTAGLRSAGKRTFEFSLACAAVVLLSAVVSLTLKQISIWRNSVRLWSHVIESDPTGVPIAYNNRGLAYQEAGQREQALSDFTTAITTDPYNFTAYLAYINRGNLFKEMGWKYRAMEDFTMAAVLNPAHANAYFDRGCMFEEEGQLDRAIEDYSKAIERDPAHAKAYNNRGVAFKESGQLERALRDFDTAISLDPFDYLAYGNRGLVLSMKGRDREALEDFTNVIRLKPDFIMAYRARAKVYGSLGLPDLSEQDSATAAALQAAAGKPEEQPVQR